MSNEYAQEGRDATASIVGVVHELGCVVKQLADSIDKLRLEESDVKHKATNPTP